MLRDALPTRPEARRMLIGTAFSSLGRGLTLPFLYIYLTEVRHLPGSTVGLLIGWFGLLTLVVSPIGGTLIDRYGARRVVLPALLLEAAGMGLLALVDNTWLAWTALTLGGLGASCIWAGQTTIFSSLTGEGSGSASSGCSSPCSISASASARRSPAPSSTPPGRAPSS
ncbi:MFS transporter [Catellatospora bangladeshensis]|uniref:MFS transporter n=1 Tax=Catellatospora bangladeshensis TaxID=310355 RepID=UPI00360BC346